MKTYITFISWEDRFSQSLKNDLTLYPDIETIYFFFFTDEKFFNKTQRSVETINSIVDNKYIKLQTVDLSFDSYLESWKKISIQLEKISPENEIIVNISTMPRNMIFTMLHFLDKLKMSFEVRYYSPIEHGKEITRNPSKPQMILQHGGTMYPEKKTALIVILGHDIKRVYQLYNFFEPYVVLIGLGTEHQTELPPDYNTEFEAISKKQIFEVNSFSEEEVFAILEEQIRPLLGNYNILLCSLGPKVEAIGIYKLHKKYRDTALVYAPSKDYADDYSTGTNYEVIKSISSSWITAE